MSDEHPSSPERAAASPARRGFLVGLGLAALGGLALLASLAGFTVPDLVRRRTWRKWTRLGPVDDFPERRTRMARFRNPFTVAWDGETAEIPCWVRRIEGDRFQVFSIHCTHLGCPVRWFSESGLFMCPCHGGIFYEDGRRAAGPPPRDLYQYEWRVRDGTLWIRAGHVPTLTRPT